MPRHPLLTQRFARSALACAVLFALQGQAWAACDDPAPGTGTTVTCDSAAPNPDTAGVTGVAGAANVTVDIQAGAEIATLNQPGVWSQGSGWQVTNAGTVGAGVSGGGSNAYGMRFDAGGTLENLAGGTITGIHSAVLGSNGLTLANAGTIRGEGGGVVIEGAAGTVTNSGVINGNSGSSRAVQMLAGGSVFNQAGGTIETGFRGVEIAGDGFVDNAGSINGSNAGVGISGGAATVINRLGGVISGTGVGMILGDGNDSVDNAGTISDNQPGGGSLTMGGGDDTLTLRATSTLVGAVDAGTGADTLVLDGTQTEDDAFNGFETLRAPGGGGWTLTGALSAPDGLTVDAQGGATLTLSGVMSGGALTKIGGGVLNLGGANTYTGGTVLSGGVLGLSADANLGEASGTLTMAGSVLRANASFSSARSIFVNNAASNSIDTNGFNVTLNGVIADAPGNDGGDFMNKIGAGTLTLVGANTYGNRTVIGQGTLALAGAGTIGAANIVIGNGAVFDVSQVDTSARVAQLNGGAGGTIALGSKTLVLGLGNSFSDWIGTITDGGIGGGTGGQVVTVAGNGAVRYFAPTRYTGGTTVAAGSFELVADGALHAGGAVTVNPGAIFSIAGINGAGTTIGDLGGSGTVNLGAKSLTLGTANDALFGGAIVGNDGSLIKQGTGTLTLSGANTYTGNTRVDTGMLRVDGALGAGDVDVASGAALGGIGTIGGTVTVADGGRIAPGQSPGTLAVGSLSLSGGSLLDYELGQAGVIGSGINDLIEIAGDLTLDGTLNIADAGGFGAGVYRLMNYGGTLTDNTLGIGGLPPGFGVDDLFVQTAIDGQINLINTAGVTLNFWDGVAGPTDDGTIQGGDGAWVASDRSWANADGSLNGGWNEGFAVFGGSAGTVTVQGEQRITGLQFMTDGYRLQGGALRASGATNLRVDPGVTATIAAPIVGDAALVKVDEGTLVLQGAFGYTGGVTVNGGRLVGDTGNLLGNIDNRAALEFAQGIDGVYADAMTGAGGLTKSGAGTLTLSGSNTHSGGTAVQAGILRVGDGGTHGSLSGDVAIAADARLAFDRSDDASFGGIFSGDGAIDKFGAGTLAIGGNSAAFAGSTTVAAGTLRVDGALGGSTAIAAGATLAGTGTLGDVDNAGKVSAGNSIGTLFFDGDYVHRAGATLLAEVEPGGGSDLLDIAGSATLEGGQVQVIKLPGQYAGETRYTLIDAAGGVSGTFDALNQDLPFLDMSLTYDANHVFLDIARSDTAFAAICRTFNQCQVATTIDAVSAGGGLPSDLASVIEELTTLDVDAALAGFDRLSGEAHASFAGVMLEGHALYGQTVSRRLADRREAVGAGRLQGGMWTRAYGMGSELDGDGNAHGADVDLHGVAFGFDAWGTESWLIGASFNAMRVNADFRPGDHGEADAKNFALYTSVQGGRAYLDGVASFAWWDSEIERRIDAGAIHRNAASEYDSHRLALYLEGGWNIDLRGSRLQPLLSIERSRLDTKNFRETGAQDLDLIGRSQSTSRTTASAGLRWTGGFARGEWTLRPSAQLRWLHSTGDRYAEFEFAFAGAPDTGYSARGVTWPEDRGLVGFGFNASRGKLDLYADYDYQQGGGLEAHNLSAGLRYHW